MQSFELYIENQFLLFLIIFIVTLIIVSFSYLILRFLVKKMTGNKKRYQAYIFKKLFLPLLVLVLCISLYAGLSTLSVGKGELISLEEGQLITLIDGTFFVIGALIVALLVSRILTIIMQGLLKTNKGFKRPPGLLNKTLTVIIFVIAIAVILAYFKIDITPLIAGVGLGALAIGLALQSTLSNYFAGLHLISDRPIEVGDYIELDENTSGIVEDIGWRSTRIKTLTDNLIIIPNAKIADSNILNYSMPRLDFSIWVPCGVAYDTDLEKVQKITLEVAKEIQKKADGAVKDFQPVLRFREFGDSNINFITVLGIEEPVKRFAVKSEFIKALKQRFDEEKIEISWPIRKIYNIKK